jgi:hypothetical protein
MADLTWNVWFGLILFLLAVGAATWPKFTEWRRRPSHKLVVGHLAVKTGDAIDRQLLVMAAQAGEIASLKARMDKAGL